MSYALVLAFVSACTFSTAYAGLPEFDAGTTTQALTIALCAVAILRERRRAK